MTDIYQPQNEQELEILRLNKAAIHGTYCQRVINQKSKYLPILREIQIYDVQLLNISDAYIDLETWIFRSDYDWYTNNQIITKFLFYWTQGEDHPNDFPGIIEDIQLECLCKSDEYNYYRVTIKY